MRRLGCLLVLVGLLLATTSLFLFGAALARLLRPGTSVMVPLPLEGSPLPLTGGAHLRVWCRLELDTDSVDRDGSRWRARYAVPLTWRIAEAPVEAPAAALAGGAASVAWDDARRVVLDEHATQASAGAVVEQPLARIVIPARGARAWAALGEDVAWKSRVRHAWLVFREDEAESGTLAIGGAAVLVLGPMLMAMGVAIVVMSWFRKKAEKPPAKRKAATKTTKKTEKPAAGPSP